MVFVASLLPPLYSLDEFKEKERPKTSSRFHIPELTILTKPPSTSAVYLTTAVRQFTAGVVCTDGEEIEAVRRKEEACVRLLIEATKGLSEARRRRGAAKRDFDERQSDFNVADRKVRRIQGAIRATRSQLRTGGNMRQLRMRLTNLRRRLREAGGERNMAERQLNRARARLNEEDRRLDVAAGRVVDLVDTVNEVRTTLESLRRDSVECTAQASLAPLPPESTPDIPEKTRTFDSSSMRDVATTSTP